MKFAAPLLAVFTALALCSCNTPNTRRDMYGPKKGSGYWTTRDRHGKSQADIEVKKAPAKSAVVAPAEKRP